MRNKRQTELTANQVLRCSVNVHFADYHRHAPHAHELSSIFCARRTRAVSTPAGWRCGTVSCIITFVVVLVFCLSAQPRQTLPGCPASDTGQKGAPFKCNLATHRGFCWQCMPWPSSACLPRRVSASRTHHVQTGSIPTATPPAGDAPSDIAAAIISMPDLHSCAQPSSAL